MPPGNPYDELNLFSDVSLNTATHDYLYNPVTMDMVKNHHRPQNVRGQRSTKEPRQTAVDIFDTRMKVLLENLGVNSMNFELPSMDKNLGSSRSQNYFNVLEHLLYEWKHTNTEEEA